MNNTWINPKIKIPKTKSEWIFDVIGYTIFIGSVIYLVLIWKSIPAEIPMQYNVHGEIIRWGTKNGIIILPIICMFIGVFLQVLERFPEVHNYPKRLNEKNANQFYKVSRQFLNQWDAHFLWAD